MSSISSITKDDRMLRSEHCGGGIVRSTFRLDRVAARAAVPVLDARLDLAFTAFDQRAPSRSSSGASDGSC